MLSYKSQLQSFYDEDQPAIAKPDLADLKNNY